MTYETISEFNQTGIEGIFNYVAEVVPIFFPMVLFAIFVIIMMGTYFSQKRLGGRSNFISSFAVAGIITSIVSFVMSIVGGLVDSFVVVICFVVAIIGVILLIFTEK